MQRWIVIGVIALVLVGIGGALGLREIRQNRPDRVWVPLQVKADLSAEDREKAVKDLKEKILASDSLLEICKELGLTAKWNLRSDEEAARELGNRLFVESGEAATAMGNVPSINVGVRGKLKEHDQLAEISMHLIRKVSKILGIKPPPEETI